MTTPPPPPTQIEWLIEVLGLDDTLRLIEARGGTRVWVPSGVGASLDKTRADLETAFGAPMVKAMIRAFGNDRIKVPLCAAWRTALYASRGLTQEAVALKLGCHADTISRRLKRSQCENRQSGWNF